MQRAEPFRSVLLKEAGLLLISGNPAEADSAGGVLATNVALSPALILASYLEYPGADGVAALRIGRPGVSVPTGATEVVFSVPLLHEALGDIPEQRRSSIRTQIIRSPQKVLRIAVVTADRDFEIGVPIDLTYMGDVGSGEGEFEISGPSVVVDVTKDVYRKF